MATEFDDEAYAQRWQVETVMFIQVTPGRGVDRPQLPWATTRDGPDGGGPQHYGDCHCWGFLQGNLGG